MGITWWLHPGIHETDRMQLGYHDALTSGAGSVSQGTTQSQAGAQEPPVRPASRRSGTYPRLTTTYRTSTDDFDNASSGRDPLAANRGAREDDPP